MQLVKPSFSRLVNRAADRICLYTRVSACAQMGVSQMCVLLFPVPFLVLFFTSLWRNEQAGEANYHSMEANAKVLDQAPPWVAEEVGHDLAKKLGETMKELSIDEHLLCFFTDSAWEMVGVKNPILRCRLLRRQQLQKATPAVNNRDSDNAKAAKTKRLR